MKRKIIDNESDAECTVLSNHSPLFHVKTTLKVLRTLSGFPILPTNSNWDNFEFIPSKEYPRLIIIIILFSVPINTIGYFYRYDLHALSALYQIDVSKLDYFVEVFTLFFLPFCFNLVYFINFKNSIKGLNSICENMSEINSKQAQVHGLSQIHLKAKQKVEEYIVIFMMMGILIAALFVISSYITFEFYDGGFLPDNVKALLAAIQPAIILLGPISHIVSSGDFIIIYFILHLTQNLECLRSVVEEENIKNKTEKFERSGKLGDLHSRNTSIKNGETESVERYNKMNTLIDIALDIGDVLEKINVCFSGMLFCYYGGNLLIATSSFYSATNYLFISEFSALSLSMGLMSAICFILYMGRLYILTTSAHLIGQEMTLLKKAMKGVFFKSSQDWSIEQRKKEILNEKFDTMIDRYGNNAPISPYGYFSINGGSLLSALATIITYLIVLIQFKISE